MKLTKDEARILSEALKTAKFEWTSLSLAWFDALTELEQRLQLYGQDKRRAGRTSQDSWSDLLKRFCKHKK